MGKYSHKIGMEKIQTLLEQLQHQLNNKANRLEMLETVTKIQLVLLSEINNTQKIDDITEHKYVSVVLPDNLSHPNTNIVESENFNSPNCVVEVSNEITENTTVPTIEPNHSTININASLHSPTETESNNPSKNIEEKENTENVSSGLQDFTHQLKTEPVINSQAENTGIEVDKTGNLVFSINDKYVNDNEIAESLSHNEKLSIPVVETAEVISNNKVEDLRKIISINEKYVFINELFRHDENMYERCIKTINSFENKKEARSWMDRELYLKLGWNNSDEIVAKFQELVDRRF